MGRETRAHTQNDGPKLERLFSVPLAHSVAVCAMAQRGKYDLNENRDV